MRLQTGSACLLRSRSAASGQLLKPAWAFLLEMRKSHPGGCFRWPTRDRAENELCCDGVRSEQAETESPRVQESRATHFDNG